MSVFGGSLVSLLFSQMALVAYPVYKIMGDSSEEYYESLIV